MSKLATRSHGLVFTLSGNQSSPNLPHGQIRLDASAEFCAVLLSNFDFRTQLDDPVDGYMEKVGRFGTILVHPGE